MAISMQSLVTYAVTGMMVLIMSEGVVANDNMSTAVPAVDLVNQPIGMGQLFQTFFGLLVVVLLIIGLAWLLRRSGRFGSTLDGQLRAVGGLSLGGRERILLVDAGGTHLLVGVSPGGGIQTLYVFPEPLDLKPGSGGVQFSSALQKILNQQRRPKNGDLEKGGS